MNEVHPINQEAWDEWYEFRTKEKKVKIGPLAEKKQKKLLSQYPPPIQQEMVDSSIMNSYQGLFPPKRQRNGQNQQQARPKNEGRLSAVDRVKHKREQARIRQQQHPMGTMGQDE